MYVGIKQRKKMLQLIQIYNMLSKQDQKLFIALFSDLDYELNEMGWKDDPETLINDMLFNHFDISFDVLDDLSNRQLKSLTARILKGNIGILESLPTIRRF
jgi:hypothetical protein